MFVKHLKLPALGWVTTTSAEHLAAADRDVTGLGEDLAASSPRSPALGSALPSDRRRSPRRAGPYLAQPPTTATAAAAAAGQHAATTSPVAGPTGSMVRRSLVLHRGAAPGFVPSRPSRLSSTGCRIHPVELKNHNAEVSQSPTSPVKTNPPSTGSAQPGIPLRVSTSIFTVKTPKKKHPSSECTSTRVEYAAKPSAYRQWTATGTVSRKAIRPDQRCRPPIHVGAATPGTLPYMTSAEPSCTSAKIKATVASQVFAARPPEKPARFTADPSPVHRAVHAQPDRHRGADAERRAGPRPRVAAGWASPTVAGVGLMPVVAIARVAWAGPLLAAHRVMPSSLTGVPSTGVAGTAVPPR